MSIKRKCLHCGLEDFTVVVRDRPLIPLRPHDTLADAQQTVRTLGEGIIIRVSKNYECQKAVAWRLRNQRSEQKTEKRLPELWLADARHRLELMRLEFASAELEVRELEHMVADDLLMQKKYFNFAMHHKENLTKRPHTPYTKTK